MWMFVALLRQAILCCTCAAALVSSAYAGDLSSDVRKGAAGPNMDDGGYFEIGMGMVTFTSPLLGLPEGNKAGKVYTQAFLDINARYQYRGFFAELFSQSLEQFTLGYNFYNRDNWALDWVGLAQHGEMSEETSDDYQGLKRRREDFMSGPRATLYLDNYIVQMHALADISRTHYGELLSLKLARHWQHRNWNFHGILGATYRSSEITDYYFSIDAEEASAAFPEHRVPAGMAYVVELGATYPISDKWVFRSFLRRLEIASIATKSSLILDDHGDMFGTSISYVF